MRKLIALAAAVLLAPGLAHAQQPSQPIKYLSAATNNSTLVSAGQTFLRLVLPINSTATPAFLKLYDKATAPTCGTDIPKVTIPVPASPAIVPPIVVPYGLQFISGLGFCLVGAIADADNSSSVTGIVINISTNKRP